MPLELNQWEQGLLPSAVAQGGEEIDRAYRGEEPTAPAPPAADANAAVEIAPPEMTETEPARQAETPASENQSIPQQEPAAPPAPPDDVQALRQRVQELEQALEQRDQAFRTLQGKYDSEVVRVHARLRDRDEEIADLKAQLEEAQLASKPLAERYGLTEEEAEALGPNELAVVEKIARRYQQKPERRRATAEPEVDPRVAQFTQDLAMIVPDWEQLNTEPGFLVHLRQPDTKTGANRQAMLDVAGRNLDVLRVAEIFLDYKRSKQTQTQPPAPAAPKPSLESQIMPGPTGAPPAQPKGYIWSQDEWEAEWKRAVELSATRPVEGERKITELKAALAEKRIRAAA